jgi:hypothetical protein
MLPVNFISQGGVKCQKEDVMHVEKTKKYLGERHVKKVIFIVRVVRRVVTAVAYAARS